MQQQIIWLVISVPLTGILTAITSWLINRPKKWKQRQEEEAAARKKELEDFKNEIKEAVQELKEDKVCGKEHKEVLDRLDSIQADNEKMKRGLQTVLRNDLKIRYEKWLKAGYAPLDAKDDLEAMYQAYHNLGQNGVLTSMHDDFLKLPNERVAAATGRRKKDASED